MDFHEGAQGRPRAALRRHPRHASDPLRRRGGSDGTAAPSRRARLPDAGFINSSRVNPQGGELTPLYGARRSPPGADLPAQSQGELPEWGQGRFSHDALLPRAARSCLGDALPLCAGFWGGGMPWQAPQGPLAACPGCGEPGTQHPCAPLLPSSLLRHSQQINFLLPLYCFIQTCAFSDQEPAPRALWRSLITS